MEKSAKGEQKASSKEGDSKCDHVMWLGAVR